MRFVIAGPVMNGSDAILDKLDDLLARVEDEVHEIEIIDADLLEDSAWYRSCRQTRQAVLQNTAKTTVYRTPRMEGPHRRRVEITDEKNVIAARHLAYTPLHVIVENFSSDGALLKFAMRFLGTQDVQELCLGTGAVVTPPAVQIESPGGHGDLTKLLQKRLDEAAARQIRPRVVVVTDSDGEWVGDVKQHAQQVRERCAQDEIPCPPLNKRTAENYVPDAVWRAWATKHSDAQPAIGALLRLSSHQRDHVNIGKANSDPWDSSKPEVRELFADVADDEKARLGLASLKGRRWRSISYILENFGAASNRDDLLERDHQRDLLFVVQSIKDEL